MGEAQAQFESVMNENQENTRLQAIGKEIQELVDQENASDNKIDFSQIMNENFEISQDAAKKIIIYINELLDSEAYKEDSADLSNLRAYLAPIANPIGDESITINNSGFEMVNLSDPTINNLINNPDYGIKKEIGKILKSIKRNSELSQLKNNLETIRDVLSNRRGINKSELQGIYNFVKEQYPNPQPTSINGAATDIKKDSTEDKDILVYLHGYLQNLDSQIGELNARNSAIDTINQEQEDTTAAIGRLTKWDYDSNPSWTMTDPEVSDYYPILNETETQNIINYIKESASDDLSNPTKKSILSTYRKYLTYTSEVPPYGTNLNQIKETVEAEYKEVGIINNFIENFINNGKDFNDTNLTEYATSAQINKNDLANLITLYIENDGSQNPDIVSYYRNNLAGEQANNIEEHYPEIQETIQSIDKLVQINKLNNFSKLSNEDISNITKYIESTKSLNASEGTPKRDILKYYNDHIKGKKGEGTHRDTDNFDAIKDAIEGTKEGQEGYREEIVQKELTELYRQLPDLINRNFDDAIIKGYRDNPENICIFNKAEFNAFRDREKTRREDTESTNNINTLKGALTETAISNFINQEYGKGITEIIAQKGNINYDNVFNSIKSGANQDLFESLNGPEKDQVQKHRTLKLNQAMFNKSKEFINNFDCNSINTRYLYGIETSAISTSIKAKLTGDDEIKINHINNPEEQQKKLYKAQKIDYILKSLQNPGNGSHKDGFDNIKPLQKEIGVTDDGKFGKDTLSSAERRINQ